MELLKRRILQDGKVKDGGKLLREQGVNLQSLAIVDSIEDGKVTFREE